MSYVVPSSHCFNRFLLRSIVRQRLTTYAIISLLQFYRLIVPLLQGYEDAGDFTVTGRLKTSIHVNLVFYLSVGTVGLLGIAILLILHKLQWNRVMGLAIACSNTFGLVTGAFLLGFGLLEIPRSIWRNANWTYRHKRLSHSVAKVVVSLDDAHQELSTAIVIAQATSNQMSRRDPLRPYMDVIDNMLLQMAEEDPLFKPSGGRMGESDMDYDADEKSMAALRRRLRKARYFYCRFKSEYILRVREALELEDTIKNYENGKSQNWRYISSMHQMRSGPVSSYIDLAGVLSSLKLRWLIVYGIRVRLISLLREIRSSNFSAAPMASRKDQSTPSASGDAGGDHKEESCREYGPPQATQAEQREMERCKLIGDATKMMLSFAKDPKLAKYMTETSFQEVHTQWQKTTTPPPKSALKKPFDHKQYSEKKLEEVVDARIAQLFEAQKKAKKHGKKQKKGTNFPGYLGRQSTFDKAKKQKKRVRFEEVPSSSSSDSSSDSSKEDRKGKKRRKKQRFGKGKKKAKKSKSHATSIKPTIEGGKKVPPILHTKDKIFEADKYVQDMDEMYKKVKVALEKTQAKQKKAADRHRRIVVFSLGDWVLLRFEKARLKKMKGKERLFPKLSMRYYGLFQVCDRISDVAYRLKLPESWKIHNAFHVSLLRPYVGDVLEVMLAEDQAEVDEILVLEQISAHKERKVKGKVARRYLVKFRNYPPMDAKWMEEEWFWRCSLNQLLQRALAITLGAMSSALLFAEATLLPNKVDLSLFSLLIKALDQQEILVQTVAFIPLMYMCACTYFSLFKLGMFTFYYLTPKYTSSVSLLMICSMVARYAAPIAYNFLNLLRLGDGNIETTFEKRMGKMDEAVPFFNDSFNRIYPLFMVVYTILIASNFFDRIINFFGSWHKFLFKLDTEDADGFDTSGLIILHKERGWMKQGHSIGENVVPLARNFANLSGDIEAEAMLMKSADVKLKENFQPQYKTPHFANGNFKTGQTEEYRSAYAMRSSTAAKYLSEKSKALLNSSESARQEVAPLRQTDEARPRPARPQPSPTDTLESIFENLKRKPSNRDFDDDTMDLSLLDSSSR
ncbi:hypothetical protein L7F22_043111 [Adiantum nelumboides]|nr:hypothetical protein [Adiantum nelumboides]